MTINEKLGITILVGLVILAVYSIYNSAYTRRIRECGELGITGSQAVASCDRYKIWK